MFGCIIQVRMNSKRFPGKVMKKIDGKNPSLFFTISQLQKSKYIKKIIIATSINKSDDIIEDFSKRIKVNCFRGDEEDVLDRYYNCAKKYHIKNIIRITGDCPLIDPTIVDNMILKFKNGNYDYIHNFEPRTFPDGEDVEILTFNSLANAWKNSKLPSEREHVTAYLRNNSKKFKIKNILNYKDFSNYRVTLDYEEDLKLIKLIIRNIKKTPILMEDIIQLLEKNPQYLSINKKYEANEGYKISLKKDKEFLKKNNITKNYEK